MGLCWAATFGRSRALQTPNGKRFTLATANAICGNFGRCASFLWLFVSICGVLDQYVRIIRSSLFPSFLANQSVKTRRAILQVAIQDIIIVRCCGTPANSLLQSVHSALDVSRSLGRCRQKRLYLVPTVPKNTNPCLLLMRDEPVLVFSSSEPCANDAWRTGTCVSMWILRVFRVQDARGRIVRGQLFGPNLDHVMSVSAALQTCHTAWNSSVSYRCK